MKHIMILGVVVTYMLIGCTSISSTRNSGSNNLGYIHDVSHPYPDGLNFR
jgi:hypothetical protein